jgi:hypothetical protein
VLDVSRRGEQPTDLFRAENNGQAARLAGRDDLLGKIAALQLTLKKNRRAVVLTLTVGTVVPIDASHN